ncbi:MAG: hypothetical protein H0W34_15705 [Pyrinomonadaceae bacterium]|nr:hypothetical protein [Pyrinomonadaceae bacterium]
MTKCIRAVIGILYILAGLNCNSAVCAFELITKEEAGRPSGFPDRLRSPFPGPVIKVYNLVPEMLSPIEFTIELKAFAGASINQNSLQVSYQKQSRVDLLPRIRDSIEAQDSAVAIKIRNAEVPPGQHQIFVQVEDTRGLASEKYLNFRIINQR